jgi:UDP-glucose 4-epimerase
VVVLLQAGYKIIIVDNCSNSTINILDKIEAITTVRPVFYQGDINNAELLQTIFAEQNIDAVIHFAAKKAVGESMQIPFEYYENNVTGTQTLLRMMDKHQVRSLVFSSTCATYNAINLPPYTEDMSTKPESVYGLTKRIDEELIE